jgi:protoheme IX farnesyltransferase
MSCSQIIKNIRIALELSKVKITIAVSFTTITGYVLGKGYFDSGFIGVTLGIFLLACGSSVLNQVQEFRIDAKMDRTFKRPLPTGEVSEIQAILLAISEITLGSIVVFLTANFQALMLGWLALIWYNFVYTPLKRITPHAVIPGSIIGAIPPLVGWVASGASILDFRAWVMAVFFFVWQVPHFYLLVLKYGPQYEKAGLPALTSRHSLNAMKTLIFIWILTTAFTALTLYYFSVVLSFISMIALAISSLWLIIIFIIPFLNKEKEFKPFAYFMKINYYVLFVIIILNIDHILIRMDPGF